MFKVCALALALLASTAQADFDWNITEFGTDEGDGFVVVKFDDTNANSEVKLNYHASNKNTTVQLLDYTNCNTTETNSGTPGILTALNPTRGTPATELAVELNIDQTAISTSSFLDKSDPQKSIISVCIRIDLWGDLDSNPATSNGLDASGAEESINFHETKLLIEVDMTKGFEVTGVSTDRTAATETNTTAELDYTVLAFEVDDATGDELTTPGTYAQGSFLTIGIITNGTGVEVADIIQMNITGNTDYDSIRADGTVSALTEKSVGIPIQQGGAVADGGTSFTGCKVKTMLVSDFFDTENPDPLTIKGLAVMKFASGRRLANIDARDLQQASSAEDTFGLTVALKPMNMGDNIETQDGDDIDMIDDSAAPASATIVGGMVSFVVVMFSFFLM